MLQYSEVHTHTHILTHTNTDTNTLSLDVYIESRAMGRGSSSGVVQVKAQASRVPKKTETERRKSVAAVHSATKTFPLTGSRAAITRPHPLKPRPLKPCPHLLTPPVRLRLKSRLTWRRLEKKTAIALGQEEGVVVLLLLTTTARGLGLGACPTSHLMRSSQYPLICFQEVAPGVSRYTFNLVCIVQWNLSNLDTNGADESVIFSEVSSFQRLKCMQEWYILGVRKGVLFREVSSVQECVLIERGSTTDHTSLSLSQGISATAQRVRRATCVAATMAVQ